MPSQGDFASGSSARRRAVERNEGIRLGPRLSGRSGSSWFHFADQRLSGHFPATGTGPYAGSPAFPVTMRRFFGEDMGYAISRIVGVFLDLDRRSLDNLAVAPDRALQGRTGQFVTDGDTVTRQSCLTAENGRYHHGIPHRHLPQDRSLRGLPCRSSLPAQADLCLAARLPGVPVTLLGWQSTNHALPECIQPLPRLRSKPPDKCYLYLTI